jgi:hypothetical protein
MKPHTLSLFILLAGTFKPGGAIQEPGAQKPSISIEISAPRIVIAPGEQLLVSVRVANKTDHRVDFSSEGEVSFSSEGEHKQERIHMVGVIIRDSHGKLLPRTKYGLSISGLNRLSRKLLEGYLKAGEVYTEEYDLTKEFDLTSLGTYTVEAGRRDPETNQMDTSNTLVITLKN